MIVFDLACEDGVHKFEAWFASSAAFAEQREQRLIACPVCGDTKVNKAVMAPRLGRLGCLGTQRNRQAALPSEQVLGQAQVAARAAAMVIAKRDEAGHDRARDTGDSSDSKGVEVPNDSADSSVEGVKAALREMIASVAATQAEMLPKSRWVGRDFVEAARAMHEGRAEHDLIHGEASAEQADELHDDGIAVMPLLVPFVPPDLVN